MLTSALHMLFKRRGGGGHTPILHNFHQMHQCQIKGHPIPPPPFRSPQIYFRNFSLLICYKYRIRHTPPSNKNIIFVIIYCLLRIYRFHSSPATSFEPRSLRGIVHPPPPSTLIFISMMGGTFSSTANSINDFSYLYKSLIEIAVAASFYLEKVNFFSHTPQSPMDPLMIWTGDLGGGGVQDTRLHTWCILTICAYSCIFVL